MWQDKSAHTSKLPGRGENEVLSGHFKEAEYGSATFLGPPLSMLSG